MIVICEECGKRYRIDPLKIKGKEASFKCKSCENIITVVKPEVEPPKPPPVPPVEERVPLREPEEKAKPSPAKKPKKRDREARKLGLRSKMIVFFFVIPIILIAGAGALYLWQLNDLTSLLVNENSMAIRKMAEDAIAENARAVAKQCQLYLSNNPLLKKDDFNFNMGFKKVAVQKVGMTGYTALYERPGADGVWRTWAHANPKIIGIDMKNLKKPLGRSFPGFWKVYTGVKGGKESRGYYTWKDADGRLREKFMVCTPVEGTPYVVASTTYLDEFTRPVKVMETRAKKQAARTRNIVFGIFVATIILIGLIVSLYGQKITGKIKSLTDVADRISVGELDAEIDIVSNDEIGDLSDAVVRMQDSIRLSIERLRRRR